MNGDIETLARKAARGDASAAKRLVAMLEEGPADSGAPTPSEATELVIGRVMGVIRERITNDWFGIHSPLLVDISPHSIGMSVGDEVRTRLEAAGWHVELGIASTSGLVHRFTLWARLNDQEELAT